MAVLNYITTFVQSVANAVNRITGVRLHFLQNTVAKAASDNDLSTYLLFKNVPLNARFKELYIENDAITGGTSYSIILCNPFTGVQMGSSLSGVMDLSAAHKKGIHTTAANVALDGLAALTHTQTLQALYELAGLSGPSAAGLNGNVDVVLLATTAGGGSGNVTARGVIIPAG